MPELPEVELACQNLRAWSNGRRISRIVINDARRVSGRTSDLKDRSVVNWDRRGKNLIGILDANVGILSHLGMTGKWVANPAPDRAHQHIQLFFDDGKQPACVALIDPRGFGHTEVINSAGLEHPRIQALGPEPSAPQFCGKYLLKRIGASRAPFKQRLMDQHVVAGLGNIAVFEIAWRVKLHPHTPCANVTLSQWDALVQATRAHIAYILEAEGGDEIIYLGERNAENPFLCYGREGEPCARCETPLTRQVLSNRPSFFCASCQPV